MVKTHKEAAGKAEAQYAEFTVKRKSDEWSGAVEEKLGKETRNRALEIRYVRGGGAELTETIRISKNANEEAGIVVKKLHLDPAGKTIWGDIEFVFGSWRYLIHIDVQKENERIDKSSPDIVKTDFGPQKIGDMTKLFDVEGTKVKGTIFGYQQNDSIYATLSDKGNLISYKETTEGTIGMTKITVHLEKLYEKESKALASFSADISVGNDVTERALDASLHLESERTNFLGFLSQQPVDGWKREMELKTANLK
jgi:hypothetical protein